MVEWKEYSIKINQEAEESVTDLLLELGSTGVSIVNRNDFERLPEDSFAKLKEIDEDKFPKESIVVKGYFSLETIDPKLEKMLHQRLEALKTMDLDVQAYVVESAIMADSQWQNKWKEFYHPVRMTRYLTVVPEWEKYQKEESDEKLILMDPGLAFGTGTHPSTQLSVQALELIIRGEEKIIDVGTGSGVLTIASSLLGAAEIYAYDVDDIAVQAAQNNIALNNLETKITVQKNDSLKDVIMEPDIIVANILANIILPLIPDAIHTLKTGGYFISSGIISEQEDDLVEALEDVGFEIKQINQMEDWIAIIAQKPVAD